MQIALHWRVLLEIALLWYFIYMALCFVRGTRTEQLLKGLVIIGLIFVVTQQLRLEAINWVLTRLFPLSVIALVVIFQPELRRGLARLGQFGRIQEEAEAVEEIASAAAALSKKKIGALIAIEREVGLKNYIETGVPIDGNVTKELITSIFIPKAPLHDGAIIIQHNRIVAAGCLLPLPQETDISKTLGMRHRAAIGLSEETDAICVIVSEETGTISISAGGKLTRDLTKLDLEKILKSMFSRQRKSKKFHWRVLSKIYPRINSKEV